MDIKEDVAALRTDIDTRFQLWYQDAQDLARELGTDERAPRAKGGSNYRATHPADSPKEYFKRSLAIPFVDDVSSQMEERFAPAAGVVSALFSLIPSVMKEMDVSELSKLSEDLAMYQDDLPRFKSLRTELEVWRAKCINMQTPPDSLIQALNLCSKDLFPNLVVLLQIACLIPVTSCEAERSFSAVRRHKTIHRSTMGDERLTSLVLMNMYMYYDVPIDTQKVVERFIQKHPRRLFAQLYET